MLTDSVEYQTHNSLLNAAVAAIAAVVIAPLFRKSKQIIDTSTPLADALTVSKGLFPVASPHPHVRFP